MITLEAPGHAPGHMAQLGLLVPVAFKGRGSPRDPDGHSPVPTAPTQNDLARGVGGGEPYAGLQQIGPGQLIVGTPHKDRSPIGSPKSAGARARLAPTDSQVSVCSGKPVAGWEGVVVTHQFLFHPGATLHRVHASPGGGFIGGRVVKEFGFPKPTGKPIMVGGKARG